jgi:hypothetical protein
MKATEAIKILESLPKDTEVQLILGNLADAKLSKAEWKDDLLEHIRLQSLSVSLKATTVGVQDEK